jgi:plastocyanin
MAIVLAVGFVVVFLWNRRAETPGLPDETAASRHVRVVMRNFVFEPREITVPIGTTVDWIDTEGKHAVQFDDDGRTAEPEDALDVGGSASRTFQTSGRYPYHCAVHGGAGGQGMSGGVIVTSQ